jgi:acyl dehydratase
MEDSGVSGIRYFEDTVIGEVNVSQVEYVVTTEELKEMAARWDPQPFHLDENAPETREYGGLITCSAHTFAIFTYLSTRSAVKTAAIAGLGFDEMRMIRPLRPGDRIRSVSTCVDKRESRSKPDRGITTSRVVLRNQRGEDVFSIKATAMILKRNASATESGGR